MFILFAGYNYYPYGGWSDCRGVFKTLEEATEAAVRAGGDWWEVIKIDNEHPGGTRVTGGNK
jgi:hypothetical protein